MSQHIFVFSIVNDMVFMCLGNTYKDQAELEGHSWSEYAAVS